MAFLNLSFEDAGVSDGCPSGWTYSTHAQREYASYAGDTLPWENFEIGWSNDTYKFAFVGSPTDLTLADYQTLNPAPKYVENFEEYWTSNQNYLFGFAGATASYDASPQAFEDFEQEWTSNESYKFAFVGPGTDLTLATYASDGNFEAFETGWTDPYLYAFVGPGTDLTYAVYDTGNYDSFEGTWTLMTTI